MQLIIKHRGKPIELENDQKVTAETTIGTIRSAIANVLGSELDKTKLLASGKMLTISEYDTKPLKSILKSSSKPTITIIVMASTNQSIKKLSDTSHQLSSGNYRIHDDIAVRENENDEKPKAKFVGKPSRTRDASVTSHEYGFKVVESLSEYADSHRAQAILERLASDRGILLAMREKKWKVGALREMKPEGKVGVDPCVLGYNVGKGNEIRLRLRTDDESGFRSISQLLTVLAHELAHNVESEHGVAFKETMRWIERKLQGKDWRGLGGKVLADGSHVQAISSNRIARQADYGGGDVDGGGGRVLGGSSSSSSSSRTRASNVGHSRLVRDADADQKDRSRQ